MQAFLLCFTSIFVALDIIGTVPMYLSLTKTMNRQERRSVVNTSMTVATIVAIFFIFCGQKVFRHLGIEIPDFKIAGGLILLLISLADLLGGPESLVKPSGSTGIVPLAVPLITGPAVLATVILQTTIAGYPVTVGALILNYLIAWGLLWNCDRVTQVIGKDGTVVLSKIAALLLAAISVAMIRSGVVEIIRTQILH